MRRRWWARNPLRPALFAHSAVGCQAQQLPRRSPVTSLESFTAHANASCGHPVPQVGGSTGAGRALMVVACSSAGGAHFDPCDCLKAAVLTAVASSVEGQLPIQ